MPLDDTGWMPDNEFLSCREVINWIAFGQARDFSLINIENSDTCSSELLLALMARADGKPLWVAKELPAGTPEWMFEQKPPWAVEADDRADRLIKRSGQSAVDLATTMGPKVRMMEREYKIRIPIWDKAKEKFLAALAKGLRVYPPPNTQAYERRTSPGIFLSAELNNALVADGWYLKDEILSIWPVPNTKNSGEIIAPKKRRGPLPHKQNAIAERMRAAINAGEVSLPGLERMPIKLLMHQFDGTKTTCSDAKRAVLSEFPRIRNSGNSDNSAQ